MKRILLCLAFTVVGFLSFAQCSIDSTQTDPGIYPDTLLPATVNQPYTQDITFVMITDTMGITITNFNIANITGLPGNAITLLMDVTIIHLSLFMVVLI